MNYQKRILLLAVIFILTGLGAFLSLKKSSVQNSSSEEFATVAITDTSAITKVEVRKGTKLLLLEKGNYIWNVNSSYEARKQLMNLMFFGFAKMEVKRPVAATNTPATIKLIQQKGALIKVVMGTASKQFYLLSNPTDPNSSLFLEDGSKQPYIIHVPGVKGDLASLLNLGVHDWRSKEIFESTIYALQSVKIAYPEKPSDNFTINVAINSISLEGMPNSDSVKVKKYLTLFPYLGVDRYLTEQKDSALAIIAKLHPLAILELKAIDPKQSNTIKLYFSPDGKNMLATLSRTGEVVTLSPSMWRYALVPKNFFVKKQQEE